MPATPVSGNAHLASVPYFLTEVPYSVVDIIQGLVIVFVIARTAIHFGWPQKLLRKGKKDA